MYEGDKKGYQPGGWTRLTVDEQINHAMGHITGFLLAEYMEPSVRVKHLRSAMVRLMMAVDTLEELMEDA